jgi:hypothetical protein
VGAATGSARAVTALLLDEMLSGAIAEQLRARDINAVAVAADSTLIGKADEDLLAQAATQQCVLVTANVADFVAIAADWHAAGRAHAGLVYVTTRSFLGDRSFVGAIVSALVALHGLPQPGTETFLRRI